VLAPEQVLVMKAMRKLLRDERGSGFCVTCLIKRVGQSPLWSMQDARRAVDSLFASPGQFVMTTVCVGCGDGVTTTAITAAQRRPRSPRSPAARADDSHPDPEASRLDRGGLKRRIDGSGM
jgi:hypothetical protein